jgi:diguanylate cyclase (GGDEF)-like protein
LLVIWLIRRYVHNSLEHWAHYDTLTNLLNRYAYNKILETELNRAQRYQHPLTLILADIDHFKTINDTYGHRDGDLVLSQLADVLRANIRQPDQAARIGGEEFAVIAPDTNLAQGQQLAERLRQHIQVHDFPGMRTVTISLGVAECLPDESPDTFFRRADQALYQAKNAGRNCVVTA